VLYAISNVGQEASVKSFDWSEYLAVMGLFGTVISGVQLAIIERNELTLMTWSAPVGTPSWTSPVYPPILIPSFFFFRMSSIADSRICFDFICVLFDCSFHVETKWIYAF